MHSFTVWKSSHRGMLQSVNHVEGEEGGSSCEGWCCRVKGEWVFTAAQKGETEASTSKGPRVMFFAQFEVE